MLFDRYSQHSFAQIPAVNTARSQFDRSFNIKDTFDFDYLVPIFVDEIVPGDTANLNVNCFARLATQKVPIMDNMYLEFFFFFVPNRLVWTNWERFCGAQDDPGDSTDFLVPTISAPAITGFASNSVYDHFGIPTDVADFEINALPLRGMNLIWNEWFRDQNLQDSLVISKDDGPDASTEYVLLKRGKRHDYFTSCLPFPQKGPAVDLPLGTVAPVITTGAAPQFTTAAGFTNAPLTSSAFGGGNNAFFSAGVGPAGNTAATFGAVTGLQADLSTATAATINQLREAWQVQSMLELDARGGTRFTEILLAHYNVVSPDARLQRPEFLGGGRTTINSHPVPQTSPTAGANAQAQLASFGTANSTGNSIGFTKSFTEHGYVLGFVNARADITYQEGLNRMWSKQTRFDYFWPKLQEIGEQAVLNQEIKVVSATHPPGYENDGVFGYQERYAEYRYKPSEIRGEFRSQYSSSLDFWHLAEEFATDPVLNEDFIQSSTPIERALAISTAPHLLFDCFFKYKHARPMLTYSVPATLGRF